MKERTTGMAGHWTVRILGSVLALALLAPIGYGKDKAGLHVKLQRKDGTTVEGEVLTVKGRDIILRKLPSSEGLTESIDGLAAVRVVKKANVLTGTGTGFLIGAATGAAVGALAGSESHESGDWYIGPRNAGEGALWGGVSLGICGAVVGTIIGALSGHDKVYELEGKSEGYIGGILSFLNTGSRSPS